MLKINLIHFEKKKETALVLQNMPRPYTLFFRSGIAKTECSNYVSCSQCKVIYSRMNYRFCPVCGNAGFVELKHLGGKSKMPTRLKSAIRGEISKERERKKMDIIQNPVSVDITGTYFNNVMDINHLCSLAVDLLDQSILQNDKLVLQMHGKWELGDTDCIDIRITELQ